MTDPHEKELPFRADFAARVLQVADATVRRRQTIRFAAATVAATVVVGILSVGIWQRSQSVVPGVRIPRQIASIDTRDMSFSQVRQTSPLDFMFPEAASLAQFSEQYSDDDSGDTIEDDAVFFPDTPADVEVDGS
jgi:hypothetical protein